MKGKLMMGAACLALLLGSCVKDDESQSVTNIRDAKTEQLKSVAALNNAQAEAAKMLAEADAALKLAQAEAAKADAALTAAKAKLTEAEAQLKEVEVEAARAELEALKAQYEAEVAYYEAEKAKHLAALEKAAVDAEAALLAAKEALIAAEESYRNTLDGMAADAAARLNNLYSAYSDAAQELLDAKVELADEKILLAQAETNLIDAEEALAEILADYDEDIAGLQEDIAEAEAKIAVLEQYISTPSAEVEAAVKEAEAAAFEANEARKAASAEAQKADNEAYANWRELYYYDYNGRLSSNMSEYIQILRNRYYYDKNGDGYINTNEYEYWDRNQNGVFDGDDQLNPRIYDLVEKSGVRVEGVNNNNTFTAWGYEVEDDLQGSKFIPLFGYVNRSNKVGEIEYQLEGDKSKSTYGYYKKELGYIDADAIAEYLTWYEANAKEQAEKNLEIEQKNYDNAVENEAMWKAIVEAALPYKEALEAYNEVVEARNEAVQALNDAKDAVAEGEALVANAKADVDNKKAAVEAYTKKETGYIAQATAEVEAYTKKETGKVAVAEAAVAAAKKAQSELKKDATAAEKEAAAQAVADAEAALAQVKKELAAAQENLSDVKKRAEWAAEDLEKAEAKLEAAEAELEAAEALIPALEEAVVVAVNACDDAYRAYQVTIDDYIDVCEFYEQPAYIYQGAQDYYKEAVADLETKTRNLEKAKKAVTDEGIQESIKTRKEEFTKLLDWKAWADEKLAAYNEAQKQIAELWVEYYILDRAYTIADAEYDELNGILGNLTNSSSYESRIADLEDDIEGWTEDIADIEQDKIAAADFTTLEEAVEQCKLDVAMAEEYVKICQIAYDAAKAAYEAEANATPAE